VIYFEVDCLH